MNRFAQDNYVVLLGTLILLPILFAIFWVKFFWRILTGEPMFYTSVRLGMKKRPFRIYKFATLKAWSAEEFLEYLQSTPGALAQWQERGKLEHDPRTTVFGMLLRRFSMDELPQLWNVIRGEMALVGPRPIIRAEDRFYGKYSALLHSVKPGMTGLWQVSGRNLTTYHRRIAINIYYLKHKSWKLDLWILYKTVWAVIGGRGAY